MNGELWAALIGAAVLLITNLAGLVKVWTDLARQKADRAATKAERDSDSSNLHDSCQKLTWEQARLKEDVNLLRTHLDDHQVQLAGVVTEIAKLGVKMDNVLEVLKSLQQIEK